MNSKFTISETKLLFKFRTHMYKVKENFGNMFANDMVCDLCHTANCSQPHTANCSQPHLFQCPILKDFVPEINQVKYEYIFGNTGEMKKVAQVLEKICETRELLLEDIS